MGYKLASSFSNQMFGFFFIIIILSFILIWAGQSINVMLHCQYQRILVVDLISHLHTHIDLIIENTSYRLGSPKIHSISFVKVLGVS